MSPARSVEGLIVIPNFVSSAEEKPIVQELLRKGSPWLDKSHLRFSNTAQQEYGPQISDAMEVVEDGKRSRLPPKSQELLDRIVKEAKKRSLPGSELWKKSPFLRVNHYNSAGGGYMHKHMDSFRCFGPVIACCSLLSDAAMAFYDTKGNPYGLARVHDTAEVKIPRRSLYFMTGPARSQWQHGIRKDQCPEERLSLTFRTVLPDAPVKSAKKAGQQGSQTKPSVLKRPAGVRGILKRPAAADRGGLQKIARR
eukprot:TRINITY_DN42295_c0_g1_i1.p1 TRINITY_DN42295_c0_g1~~TRINITY_DN42295_c0_g1_i1.p1  ORF type:complete len:253 (-),score=41.91 TRINITY_DN42295_c0_g1_i1:130-888(-)